MLRFSHEVGIHVLWAEPQEIAEEGRKLLSQHTQESQKMVKGRVEVVERRTEDREIKDGCTSGQ
eukprot:1922637-Rhodomonas_salina.1